MTRFEFVFLNKAHKGTKPFPYDEIDLAIYLKNLETNGDVQEEDADIDLLNEDIQ